MMLLWTAVAGGIGGVARFLVDSTIARHTATRIPVGTFVVNVSACFLLGVLTGWATLTPGSASIKTVLGVGLLGGYSTFSTASVEGVRLLAADRTYGALLHAGGMLVLSILASLAGLALGTWKG